ncbi:imidazoleglycerol-phosphate dehydratase HisB [Botrimarina sp.]|uniref:imidazoleglycerol-phosphate dehydratase HisB n=1 Tax=Botrimarina sp. TaxID=2795802 RepID=UPI0032EEFCDD
MSRTAKLHRQTRETDVRVELDLDGLGDADLSTGVGFFDHMLELLAKHASIDLRVKAEGDLHVDDHHTVEDVGIVFGHALAKALGDKSGIRRYGAMTLPMDETLVTAAVDLGGRYAFEWRCPMPSAKVGQFDSELIEHFWQSVAVNAAANLHVVLHHGRNTHHVAEGAFKAIARALRDAVEPDPRLTGPASTKGVL